MKVEPERTASRSLSKERKLIIPATHNFIFCNLFSSLSFSLLSKSKETFNCFFYRRALLLCSIALRTAVALYMMCVCVCGVHIVIITIISSSGEEVVADDMMIMMTMMLMMMMMLIPILGCLSLFQLIKTALSTLSLHNRSWSSCPSPQTCVYVYVAIWMRERTTTRQEEEEEDKKKKKTST